jgi:hypothetical protein
MGALFLAALAAFQVSSAFAQNAPIASDGDITVVRISAIKPGAMAGFMAAASPSTEGTTKAALLASQEGIADCLSPILPPGRLKYVRQGQVSCGRRSLGSGTSLRDTSARSIGRARCWHAQRKWNTPG